MTTKRQGKNAKSRAPARRSTGSAIGVGMSLIVLAVALGLLLTRDKPAAPGGGTSRAVLQTTGEVSEMGAPVVETPGSASGVAEMDGIRVDGADWALGTVPLDVAVRPSWTLTNTGSTAVTLGEPSASVREGCCPGPFVLDSSSLAPGQATQLTFELTMHPGMDGWHDIGVEIPVKAQGDQQILELNVTGDFRN